MIRVPRPAAPQILRREGARAADRLREQYDRDRVGCRAGRVALEFQPRLYAHRTIRAALYTAQRGKCAYCESRFGHVDFGDIEHFRPKGGVRQRPGGALRYPGYYWLVYEWTNLLLSCAVCNERHKKCVFPVEKGSRRARSHRADVAREKPLLLDPSAPDVDPETFVLWHEHVPLGAPGSRPGRITIKVLGLKRRALSQPRLEKLELVRQWCEVLPAIRATSQYGAAVRWLSDAITPGAEYAAMVRAYLRGRGFGVEGDRLTPPP